MKNNFYFYIIPSFSRLGIFLFPLCTGQLFSSENSNSQHSIQVLNSITNRPVPKVEIYTGDSHFFSDDSGKFTLYGNQFEPSHLRIEKPNFISKNIDELPENNIIYFEPVVYPVKEVNIKEAAPMFILNSPITPHILSGESIEMNASTQSLLRRLPGITIRSYGGKAGVSTISVHGGQSQRFSVMFDGVPINNEQNGGADISTIPPFLLSQVEYLPQGHSSRFGSSAVTGILNLNPSKQGSKLSLSKGNFNEWSANGLFTKSFQNLKFTLGVGRSNYDADYTYTELGDYSQVPYQINETFPGLKNAIQQNFIYSHFQFNSKNNTKLSITYFDVENSRQLSTQVYTSPIDIQDMFDGLEVISSSVKFGQSLISHSQKKTTIEYLNDKHSLNTNNFSYSYTLGDFGAKFSAINVTNESSKTIDTSKTYYTSSLFYTNTLQKIDLATSIKIESEANNDLALGYDIILKFNLTDIINSSFTFSKNYKKPNFNDLFWEPFGDPNLKTEFSSNYYIKNRIISNMGQLNLDAHFIKFDNLIGWRPMVGTSAYWMPENISSANSYGTDISFRTIPIQNTTITASYSISITENYNSSLSYHHSGKPLLYTPINSASLAIQQLFKQSTIDISTKFVGERIYRYSWPHDNILPPYFSTNVSYKYQISAINKFETYFHLNSENIFDIQYQSVFGFPVPGRSFAITITIKERK